MKRLAGTSSQAGETRCSVQPHATVRKAAASTSRAEPARASNRSNRANDSSRWARRSEYCSDGLTAYEVSNEEVAHPGASIPPFCGSRGAADAECSRTVQSAQSALYGRGNPLNDP